MNIWFIRMDKDGWKDLDLSENSPYIYSAHGSCGDLDVATKHKHLIFPELSLSGKDLAKLVRDIKLSLVDAGKIKLEDSGKRRCDLAIRYWLSIMKAGDLAFVRTKKGKVILCRVTGYISEDFFMQQGCFKRPVQILAEITEDMVPSDIWNRTFGRKTIERNAKKVISSWVENNIELLNRGT
ncbi:hypothetical protein [Vibrio parahaemolyticus]|uniref:hypothetical protein n=1 Tax=Vibrio parahaemolyticus TaxID=670 RepID=UPI00040CC08A|nr:hypothetical protein [Vibrio parahaemolyticus]